MQPVMTEMVVIIPVRTGLSLRELRPVMTEIIENAIDQSGHYRFSTVEIS
jgi:hypothetical protein